MRIDFTLGGPDSGQAAGRSPLRRLLVLADVRGNAGTVADTLAERPIARVDFDNLDALLSRYAPSIEFGAAAGGGPLVIKSFDDFHPDNLMNGVAALRKLHDLRSRLVHPSTFNAAVAELRGDSGSAPSVADVGTESHPASEGESAVLERLLGKRPATSDDKPSPTSGSTPGNAADALIRQVIAPYVVPAPSPQLPMMLSAVDATMTDVLRAVLHDPAFQWVESTWRSIQWLVSTLELDETLELHLLHVTREELDSAAPQGELWKRLVDRERRAAGGFRLSAIIGLFRLGATDDDIITLEGLAALASALDAPFITEASSVLLGAPAGIAQQPDPKDWMPLPSSLEERWQALRSRAVASRLGLALPRFLLRQPYGPKSDPITAFSFEEQPRTPIHESYLWGNPACLCAAAMARALAPEADVSVAGIFEGLPVFAYTQDDEMYLQSSAEIAAADGAVAAVQSRGIIPIVSYTDRDVVRIGGLRSIASPSRDLLG